MKIEKIKSNEPIFKPIEIKLTIETQAEAKALYEKLRSEVYPENQKEVHREVYTFFVALLSVIHDSVSSQGFEL